MIQTVIFGAGIRGKKALEIARRNGISIQYFSDNDASKWNTKYDGVPIISPAELCSIAPDANIIIANKIHAEDIALQLVKLGFSNIRNMDEMTLIGRLSYLPRKLDWNWENELHVDIQPKVSIVIKSNSRSDKYLIQSIDSINNSKINVSYEVIVWSGKEIPTVNGDIVCIVRSGTLAQAGWLDALMAQYDLYHKNSVIGSKTISASNKTIVQAGYVFWSDFSFGRYGRECPVLEPEFEYVREVDALENTGMLFSKDLWNTYISSCETWKDDFQAQIDFCFLCRKHGIPLVFQPRSIFLETEDSDENSALSANSLFGEKWRDFVTHNQFDKREGYNLHTVNRKKFDYRIFLADICIAKYDTNAGHRTTYNYIQMFIELKMQIVYLVDDMIYSDKYTTIYQQLGIFVTYGERWGRKCIELIEGMVKEFDYAFLNRPVIADKYVDTLRKNPDMIIAHYGHDLHSLRLFREYEHTGNEDVLKEAEQIKKVEYDLIEKVDFTGYPSMVEVNILKKQFPNNNIQCFPPFFFERRKKKTHSAAAKGILFVGGYYHTPNVDAACWLVKEILPVLRNSGINDPLYLLGSHPGEEIYALEQPGVIVTGYVDDDTLNKYYEKCRLAVVPLRYGAGMKGKVLEALYQGIPVVTTEIGAEGLLNADQIMYIANTALEISDKINFICKNYKQVLNKCDAEQEYVMSNFHKNAMKRLIKSQIELKLKRHTI